MKRRPDSAAREQRHVDLQHLTELGLPATKLLKVIDRLRDRRTLLEAPVGLRNVRDAQEEIFRQVAEHRDIVLDDGKTFTWEFCNFGKTLDVMSADCSEFGDVLRELHQRQPSSMANPWGLIVYFDETVPGDPLRLDQRKKFMSVYISIGNLGSTYLKHERFWFPIAICRTNIIKHVPGKWSHMLRILLRSILIDTPSVRSGVPLRCLNQALVFFKVSNLLGDEEGLRQAWSHKGANGVFPNMTILNVCNKGAKSVVREGEEFFVDIGCTNVEHFRRCTDHEIWHKADLLAALHSRLSRTEFEKKEIGFGLNHNEFGLLLDESLRPFIRPISVQTHDPTHILFADGMCNTELNLLLPVLEQCQPPLTIEMLNTYLTACWTMPRAWRATTSIQDVFSPQRVKHFRRMGSVQAFASEMMSIVPPLAHLLSTHAISRQIPDHIASFVALALLVRTVAKAKVAVATAADLSAALVRHGELFKKAYKGDGVKAKFHYARELPHQFQRDGMLLDTFTCERKHSMMKAAAAPITNTRVFERSCLCRALTLHRSALRAGIRDGLLHGASDPEIAELLGFAACTIAKDIRVDGTLMGVGDIIWASPSQCVEVVSAMAVQLVDGAQFQLGFLVEMLLFTEEVTTRALDGCTA